MPPTIVFKLDPASAVTEGVGGEQSVMVETLELDGTRYTLEVPAGALQEETEVTMTPVLSAKGLPFSGGLVVVVRFAPEGLTFLTPASLTTCPTRRSLRTGLSHLDSRGTGNNST